MIVIKGLTRRLGDFTLKPVDLNLNEGDYWVLLGPSGSGKSVFLSLIAGLIHPDGGQIFRNGSEITGVPPEKRRFSLMVQDFALFPHLTVFENIAFPLRVRHYPRDKARQAVTEMAFRIGISSLLNRCLDGLSGGEKQRVALARALIISPDLLMLDEPLNALDHMTKRELIEELRIIQREYGIPVLHVTHDFEEGVSLATQMAVIHEGKIVQKGTPEQLSLHPASPLVASFVGIRNIYQGSVEEHDGNFIFRKGKVFFTIPRRGKGAVAIPSEDVVLSLTPVNSSARNTLACTIREIRPHPPLMDVLLDANGLPLTATVTRETVNRMQLHPELRVLATFKVASVKVF